MKWLSLKLKKTGNSGSAMVVFALTLSVAVATGALISNRMISQKHQQVWHSRDKIEGFYGAELSAWNGYFRHEFGLDTDKNSASPNKVNLARQLDFSNISQGITDDIAGAKETNFEDIQVASIFDTSLIDSIRVVMQGNTGSNMHYKKSTDLDASALEICGSMEMPDSSRSFCLRKSVAPGKTLADPATLCPGGLTINDPDPACRITLGTVCPLDYMSPCIAGASMQVHWELLDQPGLPPTPEGGVQQLYCGPLVTLFECEDDSQTLTGNSEVIFFGIDGV